MRSVSSGLILKRLEHSFYRVLSTIGEAEESFEGEWKAVEGSRYFESFDLYKENGFKEKEKAEELVAYLEAPSPSKLSSASPIVLSTR